MWHSKWAKGGFVFSLVRRFIKTGIVFLVIGLLMGGFLMVRRELYGEFPDPHVSSAHVHGLSVGSHLREAQGERF